VHLLRISPVGRAYLALPELVRMTLKLLVWAAVATWIYQAFKDSPITDKEATIVAIVKRLAPFLDYSKVNAYALGSAGEVFFPGFIIFVADLQDYVSHKLAKFFVDIKIIIDP